MSGDNGADTRATHRNRTPQEEPPWNRPGILVGRPLNDLTPSERALLLGAVAVLAGRDVDELDTQVALVVRAGPRRPGLSR